MKQTTRALRALSPKRSHRTTRAASCEDDSDTPGSPGGSSPPIVSLTGRSSSRSRNRTRRRRTSGAFVAQLPELEKSEEDFKREWGITREREEILLSEFRRLLEELVGPLKPVFDRFYLRRFLRARQHDLGRSKTMFMAHLKWREANGLDTILEDFHFEERDAFLSLYPQGYHKTDKLGRPVYIQHIGAIKIKQLAEITTEDRMVRFHVQEYERCLKYIFPACSKKAGRHIDQTFAIMDVKGVGLKHLTGDVKSILGRITETDQNNYPETLGKTVIINAPTVFKMIWAMVRPMLDVRTQAKIEVAPSDYMKLLLKYVDAENIPDYLGGKSKGSLIDDVGPWKDPETLAQVEADIAKRDQLASIGEDGAILSGDSVDLEGAASGTSVPPSPLGQQQQQQHTVAADAVGQQLLQEQSEQMEGKISGRSSEPESPFTKFGAGSFPRTSGLTDSEVDEFQDARSRRQSILSTSGSSAYLSGGEDGDEYFTPKHTDAPLPGGSGFSLHSDRPPLVFAPAGPSPDRDTPAVAGVHAQPHYPQQQQEQQHTITQATAYGTPGSVAWSPSKGQQQTAGDVPAPPLQIPILARVRALEEKLPEAERPIRRYLPPGCDLPSKAVGQGTLLHRVEALERAMDTLLRAQDTALDMQRHRNEEASNGCSGCCCIM